MSDRPSQTPSSDLTRRVVLRGAALGAVGVPLLAACGGGGDSAGDPAGGGGTAAGDPPASDGAGDGGGDGSGGDGSGGQVLASTSDVPVGGGEILKEQQIVLTQPSQDEFKAFTAVCTHMQCLVAQIADGKIMCPCHGSQYSIEDGSVVGGPAPQPLAEIPITVQGNEILKA